MPLHKQLVWVIFSVCLLWLCDVGLSYANMVPGGSLANFALIAIPSFFIATVITEYAVIYLFLRPYVIDKLKLFLWVLLVNAVTNPLLQLGVLLSVSHIISLLLFEIFVVVVETVMLKIIFGRLNYLGYLAKPVTNQRTFAISFIANLVSFVAGFICILVVFEGAF